MAATATATIALYSGDNGGRVRRDRLLLVVGCRPNLRYGVGGARCHRLRRLVPAAAFTSLSSLAWARGHGEKQAVCSTPRLDQLVELRWLLYGLITCCGDDIFMLRLGRKLYLTCVRPTPATLS